MLTAFARALLQLFDPRVVRIVGAAVLLAVAVFALLWGAVGWALVHTALASWAWLDRALDVLGGVAALGLTWLLFPAVTSAFVGLFLERVAVAVEARHYPHLPKAPGLPLLAGLLASLRFLAVLVVMNVLLLPALLVPIVYPWLWWGVHGYLLGREYFELCALRRVDARTARALRRRHRLAVFASGLLIALLLLVPIVNLIAPIVATMAMVHLVERQRARRVAAQSFGESA